MKNSRQIVSIIGILTILLYSCKTSEETSSNGIMTNADFIVFEYHDASVPPDDHRSYSITVTPNKLYFQVDSYGENIKADSINIGKEKWKQCKRAFETAGIRNIVEKNETEGCTGGSGNSISIYEGTQPLFKGYQYRCGNGMQGDLEGDLNQFEKAIKEGIEYAFFSLN